MSEAEAKSLGKYRPIALLGQGGMARVLLTVAEGPIQKLLVVKEIRAELAKDAEFVTMFMDEARLAARLNHPNLVQTYEVGEQDDRPFIVMEYLEGQPLHALMGRAGRPNVPLKVQLTVLSKLLAGLRYAHELKGFDGSALDVVHRDVSPQNTFVCYDGQVKLVDFGIAKAAGSVARTETGVFKGKLGYVAPEQIAGTLIDRRADLFSVGVMLWEALAKKRMTHGEGEAAVLHKRAHGLHPKIRELVPDAPPALAEICDRAMSLDPNGRYGSAAEMLAALDGAIDALGLRATDAEIGELVTRVFAPEREKLRAVLERQLSSPPTASLRPSLLPSLAREEVPPSSQFPASPGSLPPSVDTRQLRKRSPLTWLAIGGGAVTVLAVIALAASREPTKASPVATTATAASPPASVMAPPADTVSVSIQAYPDTASILVDDVRASSNPFRAVVPRDGHSHKVSVSAPGYAPEQRLVAYDRDVVVDISLKKAPGTAPTPSSGAVDPGADLKPTTTKPKHAIDEKDPYQ